MQLKNWAGRNIWLALSALLLFCLGAFVVWQLAASAPGALEDRAQAAGSGTGEKGEGAVTSRTTQQLHYPSFGELYIWGSERSGLQLELTGRFHPLTGDEDWLPQGFLAGESAGVVYKYTVGCCPKHAAPAVVLLPGAEALPGYAELASGDWVTVRGRFALSSAETPLPMIEASLLEPSAAPDVEVEELFPTDEMPRSCTGIFPEKNYPPGKPEMPPAPAPSV
jgi:hypothetical protein